MRHAAWELYPEEPPKEIESPAFWRGYCHCLEQVRGIVEEAAQQRDLYIRLRERAERELQTRTHGMTRQERAFWFMGAVVVVVLILGQLSR